MYVKTFFSHRRSRRSSQFKSSKTAKFMGEIAAFMESKILSWMKFESFFSRFNKKYLL